MKKDVSQNVCSVAVSVDAVWGPLFLAVAAQLKERFGSAIHVYVRTLEEYRHYQKLNAGGQWDTVTFVDVLARVIKEPVPDEGSVVTRARALEARLGETMSTFTFNHRQFGRGYSLGSFYYPRAPGFDDVSYTQVLNAYSELLTFWQREVDQKKLTLFLHGEKEHASTARANNIQFRRLDNSRYQNYWYWTPNEFFFNPAAETDFLAQSDDGGSVDFGQGYPMSVIKNRIFIERATALRTLILCATAAVRYTGWKILGRSKANSYRFSDFVTFGLREYAAFRRMTGRKVRSLDEMKGSRFVYFPLHKEPEFSLQLMSPEYFNQHAAIVSVSRDLPAGVRLVVKENLFSLGRRPANFYDQINDLKNVVFLDIRESGLAVAHECEAVITVTGTAGFEAAVLGKPVITFGRHNMYSMLDHCMTVIDEVELRGYLDRVLDGRIDQDKARRDGTRFLHAVLKSSFDMGDWAIVGEGKRKYRSFGAAELKLAYEGLLASLALPNLNQVSRLKRENASLKRAS